MNVTTTDSWMLWEEVQLPNVTGVYYCQRMCQIAFSLSKP